MKLPVGFAEFSFSVRRAPPAACRAKVREFNDEFVEGDIALYDEGGKPCVLVDGFRAISLSGAGRSGAPGGTRDLTYHVAWQRMPNESPKAALPPLPLAQLTGRGPERIGSCHRHPRSLRTGGSALRRRRSRRRATGSRTAGNGSDSEVFPLMRDASGGDADATRL